LPAPARAVLSGNCGHIKVATMAKRARGTLGGGRIEGRVLPVVQFRDTALAVIRQVHDTGKPVTVTSHGRPLVVVMPAEPEEEPVGCGCMVGTCELLVSEDMAFSPPTTSRGTPGS
jgi:prevent-host-death family protein